MVGYLVLCKFYEAPREQQQRMFPKRVAVMLAEVLAEWFMRVMQHSVPTARMCHFASAVLAAYGGQDAEYKYKEYDRIAQRIFRILQM